MKKTNLRLLTVCGMLAALSIILGRYFTIYLTESMKITFDKIPVLLAGLWFGPIAGALVGFAADSIGAVALSSFGWNPLLSISPALMGLIAGVLARMHSCKIKSIWRVLAIVLTANVLCPMLLQTALLTKIYGSTFLARFCTRAPLQIGIAAAEATAVYFINKTGIHTMIMKDGE